MLKIWRGNILAQLCHKDLCYIIHRTCRLPCLLVVLESKYNQSNRTWTKLGIVWQLRSTVAPELKRPIIINNQSISLKWAIVLQCLLPHPSSPRWCSWSHGTPQQKRKSERVARTGSKTRLPTIWSASIWIQAPFAAMNVKTWYFKWSTRNCLQFMT